MYQVTYVRILDSANAQDHGGEWGFRSSHHHRDSSTDPRQRQDDADEDARPAAGGHQAYLLQHPDGNPEAQVRGDQRTRLLLRGQGPGPFPRQHLHAARRPGRGVSPDPLQVPLFRRTRPAAGHQDDFAQVERSGAGDRSDRFAASRPPWLRSSIRSTRSARTIL